MFTKKFLLSTKKWAGGEENVENGMGLVKAHDVVFSPFNPD